MQAPKVGGAHDRHHTINGRWTEGGTKLHINVLELTITKFAIFSLLPLQIGKKRLRVMTNNSIAIPCINRQRGSQIHVMQQCDNRDLGILY